MGSDSAMNAASGPALSRDVGKKKRTNRSAKLKQCKLDARREQWLSQVKNKGGKEPSSGGSPPSPVPQSEERHPPLTGLEPRPEENERSSLHDSDSESLSNGPSNDPRKEPHTSSGSSSTGSYSGSVSEDEEDDSLDDWEAIADALNSDSTAQSETPAASTHPPPKYPSKPSAMGPETSPRPTPNCRAWRADDAFRPQSLPNLSKQLSLSSNTDRRYNNRQGNWAHVARASPPSSCPICYEDLDPTDTSFLPCLCGFHLCLFCHKRILEADGRCPGCRKPYGPVEVDVGVKLGAQSFRLSRSFSMNTRC